MSSRRKARRSLLTTFTITSAVSISGGAILACEEATTTTPVEAEAGSCPVERQFHGRLCSTTAECVYDCYGLGNYVLRCVDGRWSGKICNPPIPPTEEPDADAGDDGGDADAQAEAGDGGSDG